MSRQEVLENWVKIMKEIKKIKERNKGLVLIGDFNRAIGSGKTGVKGNNPEVSYGGRMIRDLLEQEDEEEEGGEGKQYYLLNGWEDVEGG